MRWTDDPSCTPDVLTRLASGQRRTGSRARRWRAGSTDRRTKRRNSWRLRVPARSRSRARWPSSWLRAPAAPRPPRPLPEPVTGSRRVDGAQPVSGSSPSTEPSPSPSAAPAASTIAVPAAELVDAGKLTVCSDIPYPPQEFFDANGNPTGSDIDIGAEIAKRLGLDMAVNNTVFDTIIAALQGGKCDIIISAQNITRDRIKQVDMIPYFQAGQSFVVAKGNPKGITATTDLCGKNIAAETGTTEVNYLRAPATTRAAA